MALSSNVSTAIQQIFVGLLGRPVAQQGLAYWTEQVNNGFGLEEVMANIVNEQPEYLEAFGDLDRAEAVTLHFQQLFGRNPTIDAAGNNYWINGAGADVPVNELVLALIAGAQGNDVRALENRVLVADLYTRAAAESNTFDIEAAKELIADVDHTTASVTAALEELDAATLNVASTLADLFAAEEARDEFLAGLELDTDGDGVVDVELGTATRNDVELANTNAQTELSNHAGGASRARLEADLSDANDALADARAALAGVPGLAAAVETLTDAQVAYQSALSAQSEGYTEFDAEAAKAETLNDTTYTIVAANALAGLVEGGAVVSDGAGAIIELGADGQLVAADGVDTSSIRGFAALLAEAQEAYSASVAVAPALSSFDAALTAVLELEGVTSFVVADYRDAATGEFEPLFATGAELTWAVLAGEEGVATAEGVIQQREALIAAANAAQAREDQLDQLDQVVADLRDLLTAADYELINLDVAGPLAATTDNDIFLYAATDSSITGFGAEGEDVIFFGQSYTLVQLEDGQDINTARVGNQNALEIFWERDAGNLVLYVEDEPFGGNAPDLGGDITTITLTGGAALELVFADGFLSVA